LVYSERGYFAAPQNISLNPVLAEPHSVSANAAKNTHKFSRVRSCWNHTMPTEHLWTVQDDRA